MLGGSQFRSLQDLQEPFNRSLQGGQVAGGGFPDDVRVDLEVAVHQDISHTDDLCPRYVLRQGSDLRRKRSSSLADDLQVSDEPSLEQFVMLERFLAPIDVTINGANCFQNIPQAFLPDLSNWHCLSHDAVADPSLETPQCHDIDAAPEQRFQLELKSP